MPLSSAHNGQIVGNYITSIDKYLAIGFNRVIDDTLGIFSNPIIGIIGNATWKYRYSETERTIPESII